MAGKSEDGRGGAVRGLRRSTTGLRGTTRRVLGLVVLVVALALGATFTLGQTFGRQHGPSHLGGAASPSHVGAADHAASTDPDLHGAPIETLPRPTEAPHRTAAPTDAEPSRPVRPPMLGPEQGGPYGSRQSTGSSAVALTFDDGPSPKYTPQVLALLRQYGIKATFCLIGTNVQQYPELVRQIAAEGHTLCNHSWSHDVALGDGTREMIETDLIRTSEAIQAAAPGVPIAYYRQPGGNWTTGIVSVARSLGMTPLDWAVDPRDWELPGATSVIETVLDTTVAGSIVLMHDGGGDRSGTVSALREILPDLARRFPLEALPTGENPALAK